MATSTCIKCDSTRFEMKEGEVKDSRFRVMFIQCASCGGVIGVKDFQNTNALIQQLAEKLRLKLS